MTDSNQPRGVEYEVDTATLRKYANASVKERLNWLEEVNELVEKTSSRETLEIRERFRNGKL